MWKRNVLFLVLCLTGLVAVSAGLLRRERVEHPRHFWSQRYAEPDYRTVIDKVNGEFRAHWQNVGVEPAPRADDLMIARRLSLGLTGTIPSLEEIRKLEKVPPEDRVEWWVSRLLEDRRYSDYIAERLARAFVGTDNGPFLVYRRRRFVTWLSDRLFEDDPRYALRYDALVRKLLAEDGLWTDKPAVNFVTATLDPNNDNKPDPIRLAGRTSRAFLGLRIDCLQCHDDKLGHVSLGSPDHTRDGQQSDFHQLAAFFGSVENSPLGVREKEKTDGYKYKYLHAEQDDTIPPVVPYFPNLVEKNDSLRWQLAQWVTHKENKPFARAVVNRFWALMFGRPLVQPIDDIPLFGPFPPALETLSEDFVQHNYDLRRLIRVIAATEVFQRDSRADFPIEKRHEAAWAAFPLSRLRPEQVAGGVIQAASVTTIDASSHIISQLTKFGETNNFVERYGDMGEDEFTDRGGTITQRLLMMNGELVKERTREHPILNASTRIAALSPDVPTAVDTAYLTVLTRRPTAKERECFVHQISDAPKGQRNEELEDLFWSLLNSTEFSWNH